MCRTKKGTQDRNGFLWMGGSGSLLKTFPEIRPDLFLVSLFLSSIFRDNFCNHPFKPHKESRELGGGGGVAAGSQLLMKFIVSSASSSATLLMKVQSRRFCASSCCRLIKFVPVIFRRRRSKHGDL